MNNPLPPLPILRNIGDVRDVLKLSGRKGQAVFGIIGPPPTEANDTELLTSYYYCEHLVEAAPYQGIFYCIEIPTDRFGGFMGELLSLKKKGWANRFGGLIITSPFWQKAIPFGDHVRQARGKKQSAVTVIETREKKDVVGYNTLPKKRRKLRIGSNKFFTGLRKQFTVLTEMKTVDHQEAIFAAQTAIKEIQKK
jgi:hypothetical protein